MNRDDIWCTCGTKWHPQSNGSDRLIGQQFVEWKTDGNVVSSVMIIVVLDLFKGREKFPQLTVVFCKDCKSQLFTRTFL